MASWPLQAPLISGYEIAPDNPVIRTEMEGGSAKTRRRFTQSSSMISVSWVFNQTQFATFESFHKNTIYDGQAWFDITLYNGQGGTTHSARFVDMWKAQAIGCNEWKVNATLEVKTRPLS